MELMNTIVDCLVICHSDGLSGPSQAAATSFEIWRGDHT